MKRTISLLSVLLGVLAASTAHADDLLRVHTTGAVVKPVSGTQESEFGWGGGGSIGAEVCFAKVFGVEVEGGAMGIAQGAPPADPTLARKGAGSLFSLEIAPRFHWKGAWLDAGGGVAVTGDLVRPMVGVHGGYDFSFAQNALTVGPFVGYEQVIQTDEAALSPGDARIVLFGLHASFGSAEPKPVPVWNAPTRAPERKDSDKDFVFDDEDACPEVFGIWTSDPKTNGCPSDRDKDTIVDAEDACPDVSGIHTSDPATNGCPQTRITMVDETLQLPDVIHFGFGNPDISEKSMPLVREVADYIKARGDVVRVDIEGHADEVGSEAYNYNLSLARAKSVKKLLESSGVTVELVVHAFGKLRPIARGTEEWQLRQNRRVEFTITREHASRSIEDGHAQN